MYAAVEGTFQLGKLSFPKTSLRDITQSANAERVSSRGLFEGTEGFIDIFGSAKNSYLPVYV